MDADADDADTDDVEALRELTTGAAVPPDVALAPYDDDDDDDDDDRAWAQAVTRSRKSAEAPASSIF